MASWLKVTLILYALEPAPRFGLRHPFSQALITVYKSMTGSAFDYASKLWHFPFEMRDEVLRRVREVRGTEIEDFPSFVTAFLNSIRKSAALNGGDGAGGATGQPERSQGDDVEMEEEIKYRMESIPEALWATLYPFQVECVRFAIRRRGRILLGDEMGLGKTLQALAVACAYREDWPLLVVAPSSLRQNWQNEAIKWVPGLTRQNTQIVKDAKAGVRDDALMVIVSYELASRMVDNSMLWKGQFQVVVADESHYLKSVDAKRSRAIVPLMKKAARAMCVTGTPALSRPGELFMQINALLPEAFPSFHPFAVRYCAAHQGPFGLDVSGSSNTGELKMLLEHAVMIRRLKEEVLSDMLPEKDRQVVDVPCDQEVMKEVDELLSQKEEIDKALNSTDDDLGKLRLRGMQQGVTSQLYCASGRAKVKGVLAHLKNLLANGTSRDVSKADEAIDDHHDGKKKRFFPVLPSGASSPRESPSASQGRMAGAEASATQINRFAESNAMSTESGSRQWTCTACTFLHPSSERKCELCENLCPRKERIAPATAWRGAEVRDGRSMHNSSVAEKGQNSTRRQLEATRVEHVKDETDSSLDDSDVAANSDVDSRRPGTRRGRENVAVEGAGRGGGGGSDGGDFIGLRGARLRRRAHDGEDDSRGDGLIGGAGKKRFFDEDGSGGGSSSGSDFDMRAGESKSRIRKRAVLSPPSDSANASMLHLRGTSTTAERLRAKGRREKSTADGMSSDADDGSSSREDGTLLNARHGSRKREGEKINQSRAANTSLGMEQTVAPSSRRRAKFSGKAGRRQRAAGGGGSGGGFQRIRRINNRYGEHLTSSDSDGIESALDQDDDEEFVPGDENCDDDDDDDDDDDYVDADDDEFVPSTTRRGANSKKPIGKKAAVGRGTGKGNGRGRAEVQTTLGFDSGVVVEGGKREGGKAGDGGTGGQGAGQGKGKWERGQELRKLVVFAHHKDVMDTLERGLGEMGIESVRIDGSTVQNKRQPIVDRFQAEPKLSVILLAITAAGVGITLTSSSCAVFAELYWTPGSMAQAEDRIHRIGQASKTVLIQYMVGRGTMDDTMLSSIHRKQSTLKSTVGLNRDAGGYSNVPGREHRLLSPGHTPSPSRKAASRAILPAGASQRKLNFASVSHQQQPAAAAARTGMSVSSGSKSEMPIESTFGLSRESDAAAMQNLGRHQRSPPPPLPPTPLSTSTEAANEVVDLGQSPQRQPQQSQLREVKPPPATSISAAVASPTSTSTSASPSTRRESPQSFRDAQRAFLAGTAVPSPAAAAAAASASAASNLPSEIPSPSSFPGAGTNTSVAWSASLKPTGVTAAIAPGPNAGGKGVPSSSAARGAAGDRKQAEGGLSVEIQERIARNRQMALQKLAETKRQRELQYQQQRQQQRHQQPQQRDYPCAPQSLSQGSVNGYPPQPRSLRSLSQGDNGRNGGLRLTPVLHGHQEQRQQPQERRGAATTAPSSPASGKFSFVRVGSNGSPQRPVASSTSAIAATSVPSSLSSSTSLTGVSKRGTPSAEGRASLAIRSTSPFQHNTSASQAQRNGLRGVVEADVMNIDVESSATETNRSGRVVRAEGWEETGA